jgi:hypothetical protein
MRLPVTWALLALLTAPASLQATAGFAERHSEVHYNSRAQLHWIHPGDGCDAGSHCFQVRKADDKYASFPDLYASLMKISRPVEANGALVLGQTCAEEKWFVYDLDAQAFVAPMGAEENARAAWAARGLPDPELWDAKAGGKGLRVTFQSRIEDWGFFLFLFAPVALVLGVPVFVTLAWRFYGRFKASRQPLYAALALCFAMPLVLILALLFRVFVPVFAR